MAVVLSIACGMEVFGLQPPKNVHRLFFPMASICLLENVCYFPLLILKRIYHYWMFIWFFLFFQWCLSKWKIGFTQLLQAPGSLRSFQRAEVYSVPVEPLGLSPGPIEGLKTQGRVRPEKYVWVWGPNESTRIRTAGFSPYFHVPGFHPTWVPKI